ncbi:hypothetical protein ACTXT7_010544 [Hymenolepis weldensis]
MIINDFFAKIIDFCLEFQNARKAKIRKGTLTDPTGLGGGGSSLEASCTDLEEDGEASVTSTTSGRRFSQHTSFNLNPQQHPSFIPRNYPPKPSLVKESRSLSISGSAVPGAETDASQRKWKPSFGSVRFLPITDTLIKRTSMLSQEEEGSNGEKEENENKVEEQKTPLITSVAQNKEYKNNGKSCEIQICVEEGSNNYESPDMENLRIGGSQCLN